MVDSSSLRFASSEGTKRLTAARKACGHPESAGPSSTCGLAARGPPGCQRKGKAAQAVSSTTHNGSGKRRLRTERCPGRLFNAVAFGRYTQQEVATSAHDVIPQTSGRGGWWECKPWASPIPGFPSIKHPTLHPPSLPALRTCVLGAPTTDATTCIAAIEVRWTRCCSVATPCSLACSGAAG